MKRTYYKPRTEVFVLDCDDLLEDITASGEDTDAGSKQMELGDIWDETDMDRNPWDDYD